MLDGWDGYKPFYQDQTDLLKICKNINDLISARREQLTPHSPAATSGANAIGRTFDRRQPQGNGGAVAAAMATLNPADYLGGGAGSGRDF